MRKSSWAATIIAAVFCIGCAGSTGGSNKASSLLGEDRDSIELEIFAAELKFLRDRDDRPFYLDSTTMEKTLTAPKNWNEEDWRQYERDTENARIKEVEEVEALQEEYRERFGRDVELLEHYRYPPFGDREIENADKILFLKYALKKNKPYERREFIPPGLRIIANYELQFGRDIPDCRYSVDACEDNLQFGFGYDIVDTENCRCGHYLYDLLIRALYETKEPLPEKVIVTELDIWQEIYHFFTSKRSFPAWFDEATYGDKVIYLKHAVGPGIPHVSSYLSRKQEEAIRIQLEKTVAELEKELGRKLTELEKVKTEFVIQFGKRPPAYRCSDDEFIIFLKHHIRYNTGRGLDRAVTKDDARYLSDGQWWDDIKRHYR